MADLKDQLLKDIFGSKTKVEEVAPLITQDLKNELGALQKLDLSDSEYTTALIGMGLSDGQVKALTDAQKSTKETASKKLKVASAAEGISESINNIYGDPFDPKNTKLAENTDAVYGSTQNLFQGGIDPKNNGVFQNIITGLDSMVGTDEGDLKAQTNGIVSKLREVGFENLRGAGAVSNDESRFMADAISNLSDTRLSPDTAQQVIKDLKSKMMTIQSRVSNNIGIEDDGREYTSDEAGNKTYVKTFFDTDTGSYLIMPIQGDVIQLDSYVDKQNELSKLWNSLPEGAKVSIGGEIKTKVRGKPVGATAP